MMDIQTTGTGGADSSQNPSGLTTLTPAAYGLERLDDKLATGMSIADVANARWLTSTEVLAYLDAAAECDYVNYPTRTSPPATPPTTGTLLIYNSVDTPNYGDDGIEWISDPGVKWKNIERVLARYGDSQSDSDSQASKASSNSKASSTIGKGGGSSSNSSSAMMSGASAEYLSCATRNTFHRREYRGPNNFVLLHYLDSVRALRMTSTLVDRIVLLSADSKNPSVASKQSKSLSSSSDSLSRGDTGAESSLSGQQRQQDLGETMNILMGMVDGHDAAGTSSAEAVDEHVMKAATDAAYIAVMKHVAPDEAMKMVGCVEDAMEDNLMMNADIDQDGGDGGSGMGLMDDLVDDIEDFDVTALDIDEAISQVLGGTVTKPDEADDEGGDNDGNPGPAVNHNEGGSSSKRSVSSSDDSGNTKAKKGVAEIIEDRIINSMEEVLPDELRLKLINTTEVMLGAAGVKLGGKKGRKNDNIPGATALGCHVATPGYLGGSSPSAPGSPGEAGHALPEIVDVTPDFHVMGYQPLTASGGNRRGERMHSHSIVISTGSPVPGLPPYVDQYYTWERFAAFVDFQEVADDPQVRNVSFNRMTYLTPFSFKVKMPCDIPNFSIRHIVVVGVLLPKDHRVKRNLKGIELALKLTLQTEWSAAADLVGAYAKASKKGGKKEIDPIIKGIRRPIFIAPCGGNRMQLLTQISKIKFTMYPASSLPQNLSKAMSSYAPNFVQRVSKDSINNTKGSLSGPTTELGHESKRKRDNYFEEWATMPGMNANMTTAQVDRHHKVRFVERISNAITAGAKGEATVPNLDTSGDDTKLDGINVDDMPEEEVDNLLGHVLMRYIEVCIGRCNTKEELMGEINWSGYAGLSMLHHACFYNFMELITLLLNNDADTNILSAEGDLTPLHFAASAGHKDVAEILVRKGCNPIPLDSNGETPADHARKAGYIELAAMLSAYDEQAGIVASENRNDMDAAPEGGNRDPSKTTDVFLQSAFKELSLKDKLGLNLFMDRSKAAPMAFVRKDSAAMITGGEEEYLENSAFSFISEEDRIKLREAMSLANETDLIEMNLKAEHQDVRRYLRQSNYEAISAASQALEKSNRKESDILKNASSTSDDPSKMQLSRALAMLVLRKNLPTIGDS